MSPTIAFTVPGLPRGKARPRLGYKRIYTPATTVRYEQTVALMARQALAGRPLLQGALQVQLDIRLPVPASWPRQRRTDALTGRSYPTGKPDIDNVAKALLDGLNRVLWHDDAQVVTLQASKCYAAEPGVRVTVRSLGGADTA